MSEVARTVDDFVKTKPPPLGLKRRWFGLTYINVVWQEKMLAGMLHSLLGSFLVVLFMMALLFRSFLWGLLAMAPLTVTIGLIYGVIGLIGKDYDMPVAVLSSLALGLCPWTMPFISWQEAGNCINNLGPGRKPWARFSENRPGPLPEARSISMLKHTMLFNLSLSFFILFMAQPAFSEGLSVETIVEKTNRVSYYHGKDGRAKVLMEIKDNRGNVRKRQFTILRMDEQPANDKEDKICGDQKFYVYFHRWLYLPALDLVKRIAASDERTSFVGSNFFYEDVSGRGIVEDTHELVETVLSYPKVKYNNQFPDNLFTERFLRNPPRKYLR